MLLFTSMLFAIGIIHNPSKMHHPWRIGGLEVANMMLELGYTLTLFWLKIVVYPLSANVVYAIKKVLMCIMIIAPPTTWSPQPFLSAPRQLPSHIFCNLPFAIFLFPGNDITTIELFFEILHLLVQCSPHWEMRGKPGMEMWVIDLGRSALQWWFWWDDCQLKSLLSSFVLLIFSLTWSQEKETMSIKIPSPSLHLWEPSVLSL